jgi:predicted enzyme related to lactoylglutathione lyase
MDAKITHIPVVVKDQAAALQFYTEKLGFEKKADITGPGGYRWVTVGPKGQEIELHLFKMGTQDANGVANEAQPGKYPPIVLSVGDCRAAFAELKSRGVEFKQAQPEVNPYGITAIFTDLDGNVFQMNQLSGSWK